MDANAVIVNWNARQDTLACLACLSGWQRLELRLWVVDNGSQPDDSAAICAANPNVTLIRSEHNLGFSAGTNLALRRILVESPAPVLLLNNDVSIEESAVEALVATLEQEPRCGIVGPVLYRATEPREILSAGSRNPLLHRDPAIRTLPPDSSPYPVAFVTGAAVLIRESVLRQVGLLDESYFFALELADLCRRARASGYRCLVDGRAVVEHDVERSSDYRQTLYVYYAVRNRLLYARRAVPVAWPAAVVPWALYGLQQGLRLWWKGKRATAVAILKGSRDGLVGRFGGRNDEILRACGGQANEPQR